MTAAADPAPVFALRRVSKRFGPVVANDAISLALLPGEIHGLLGENGAGKTTLLNLLAGTVQPDTGQILREGSPIKIASPATARRCGIGVVHQHFALVPTLTLAENALLGGPERFPNPAAAGRRLAILLDDLGFDLRPDVPVGRLSLGQRQRAEIARALFHRPRLLLLDEPTAALAPVEVDPFFALLRRLAAAGPAVLLITHKLPEALAVCDRITVLRHGRLIGTLAPNALADRRAAEDRLLEWMFGAVPAPPPPRPPDGASDGEPLVSLRDIVVDNDQGGRAVHDLSLDLSPGQIVGIAGVDGNGQRELAEALAGQRPLAGGRIDVAGRRLDAGVARHAAAGISYLSDERLGEAIAPGLSVAVNLASKAIAQRRAPFVCGPWLDRSAVAGWARQRLIALDVRPRQLDLPAARLSGGNLQKLLVARELALAPRLLVAKEPTAGLDLRTARAVAALLRDHAAAGNALLIFASDLDELLALADPIGVMVGGRLVALFPRAAADRTTLGRLMTGAGPSPIAVPVPA